MRYFEQPTIMADIDMMEYKNNGGKMVALISKRQAYTYNYDKDGEATATAEEAVDVCEEEKSISAVTWDSDPTKLQAKLAANEENLDAWKCSLQRPRCTVHPSWN